MKNSHNYHCPVCGYPDLVNPPIDFNICPSCGTEFGYSDSGTTFQNLRINWIKRGAHWSSDVDNIPPNWNPYQQLISFNLSEAVPFPAPELRSQPTVTVTMEIGKRQSVYA
jgi:hypothetical protein